MRRWNILALLGILAVLFCSPGCNPSSAEPNKTASKKTEEAPVKQPPVNVKIQKVGLSSMTEEVLVTGVTAADAELIYSAEIAGKIEYLGVELGKRVRRGQVLARIDYKSLKAQANQAEARYELDNKTLERLEALKKDDLVPQERIDQTMASLVVNKAQVEIAKANLDKSVVRAKRNGIVTQKNIEQGEFVSPGTPMIRVVDYRTILVDGQLSESQVSKVKVGAKAKVSINALDKEYMGQVQAVLPVADPASKTFMVRVKVQNPEFQILVGMAATISIALKNYDNVIMVKQDVVVEEGESRSVFIVGKDGKAHKREVKLGPVDHDRVVLVDGVKHGEKLVVLGQRELKDGQQITVVQ